LMNAFPKELKHVIFPTEATAENLCKWCSDRLEEAGLMIKQVAIWETPSSKAVYIK
jgi:6-pyruvoyl-tetrahydropterin synthase